MVKIKIRKRVKKTKPIKLVKNKTYVFKKRPIVLNYIPSREARAGYLVNTSGKENFDRDYEKANSVNYVLSDENYSSTKNITALPVEKISQNDSAGIREDILNTEGIEKDSRGDTHFKTSEKIVIRLPKSKTNVFDRGVTKYAETRKILRNEPQEFKNLVVPKMTFLEEEGKSKIEKANSSILGLPFPEIKSRVEILEGRFRREELHSIDIKYPLIPRNPTQKEEIFAYANIYWDSKLNELFYKVVEPELGEEEKKILEILKEFIREKIDIDFAAVKKFEARNYLFKKIDDAMEYFRLDVPETVIKVMRYYVNRDFLGFERIEPLLQDDNIEDISCDGIDIPIYIIHKDPRFGSIKTNISFLDSDVLDSFVMKLAQRAGKDISMAHPLLNGILPDNSRIQATLATDIARRGSNFTIRKFSKDPFTPSMHILYNSCDVSLMAYIWFALENNRSILVSGGTGSGKTSLLNSISMLARPQEKIVSIEDTGELQLPHTNWIPEVARESITSGGRGSVTLFDLLKESLRQRPDRIIVGEVRGKEAFVLFQSMATGHPGLATIHAESMDTLVDRLITKPINLPPTLLELLDVVIFISRVKVGDKYLRRITSIEEIVAMNYETNRPITNTFAKWNPKTDKFEIVNKSIVLKNISERMGIDKDKINEDIKNKAALMEWLTNNKVVDFRKVGDYLSKYNSNPKKFLEQMETY